MSRGNHQEAIYRDDRDCEIFLDTLDEACSRTGCAGLATKDRNGTQNFLYAYSPKNGLISSVSNTLSGLICSYEYDLMDRTTRLVYTLGTNLIRSLEYEYDDVSMITKKTIQGGASSISTTYTYDSLDRLIAEQRTAGILPAQSNSYAYDLAGNRISKISNGWKTSTTLGTGNRLASSSSTSNSTLLISGFANEPIGLDDRWGELWVSNLTVNAGVVPSINGYNFFAEVPTLGNSTNTIVAAIRDAAGNMGYATNHVFVPLSAGGASSTSSYAYDTAGCLTNMNGAALQWDERYRLKRFIAPTSGDSVEYEYDALNRCISRTETTNTIFYIYNGNQVAADLDESGNLLRTYIWGQGIDNLLAFTDHTTSNTYYTIKDHQNTILALVDPSGAVVEPTVKPVYSAEPAQNSPPPPSVIDKGVSPVV